jgi:periplasmic protein TonB
VIANYRIYQLPWELAEEQDQRFRKLLRQALIAALAFSIVVPLLPVSQPDPGLVEEPPPRFARLLLEKPVPPTPPPPAPVIEPRQLAPSNEAIPATPDAIVNTPKAQVAITKPQVHPQTTGQARQNAAKAGLLPFADELASLRDSAVVDNVVGDANLGMSAGQAQQVERSVIASRAGSGSGGINTSNMSRNTGGGGLAARGTTQVSSPDAALGAGNGPQVVKGGASPSRSREEIELVFDQNKSAIFALYNRALRRDSTLQGKVVLELTIAPSGAVTDCRIISSDLRDAELEQKLVQRVRMFQFEARDVAIVTTTKPIDFFPA